MKKITTHVQLFCCTALLLALAVSGLAQVPDSDSPSYHNLFSVIHGQVINQDSCSATLTDPNTSAQGLSDFIVECDLHTAAHPAHQINLQISDDSTVPSGLTISYEPGKGWNLQFNSSGKTENRSLLQLPNLSPDAPYHFSAEFRHWDQTNLVCTIQVSAPDQKTFISTVNNLPAPTQVQLARHLQLTCGDHSNIANLTDVTITPIDAYNGPSVAGVDVSTLYGKVMCGYQGWFGAPGDGSPENGWRHWTKDNRQSLEDGTAKIDLWPDVSDLPSAERIPTGFKLANGQPAEVFSSFERPTVLKHFEWMQQYGIDGVFVQRFANGIRNPVSLDHCNTVLASCREGANLHGRTYAVMYDLSGLPAGHIDDVINDWRALRKQMAITDDPAYLHHHGKPVVAVWGIGFNDHRAYTLADCKRLIEFLKNDPESGGCTVMIGVPAYWRILDNDALDDPELLNVISLADIVSPWTVGRYADDAGADYYLQHSLQPDQDWCREHHLDYMPVVFPGFSWHNMYGAPSNQIPRRHGDFLWTQFKNAKAANVSMLYVAMFDEVDEGTAIFKCANNVPVGEKSKFVTYEGLPSDFYLKMVGRGTRLIQEQNLSEIKSPDQSRVQ